MGTNRAAGCAPASNVEIASTTTAVPMMIAAPTTIGRHSAAMVPLRTVQHSGVHAHGLRGVRGRARRHHAAVTTARHAAMIARRHAAATRGTIAHHSTNAHATMNGMPGMAETAGTPGNPGTPGISEMPEMPGMVGGAMIVHRHEQRQSMSPPEQTTRQIGSCTSISRQQIRTRSERYACSPGAR